MRCVAEAVPPSEYCAVHRNGRWRRLDAARHRPDWSMGFLEPLSTRIEWEQRRPAMATKTDGSQ